MNSFTISYTIKFVIKFAQHYVWNQHKELFNLKTGRNGGSIGYVIDGKFYSCKKLKKDIIKQPKTECPF